MFVVVIGTTATPLGVFHFHGCGKNIKNYPFTSEDEEEEEKSNGELCS